MTNQDSNEPKLIGRKRVRAEGAGAVADALSGAPTPAGSMYSARPMSQDEIEAGLLGARALRAECDRLQLLLTQRDLEINNLQSQNNNLLSAAHSADLERVAAIRKTHEIRGVIKALAAILVKWDGWHDGEVAPGDEQQ